MSYSMSDFHKGLIRDNRVFMLENGINLSKLVNILYQDGGITKYMLEEINVILTDYDKFSKLLNLLPKRGPNAFKLFINALIYSNNIDIAMRLDPTFAKKSLAEIDIYSKIAYMSNTCTINANIVQTVANPSNICFKDLPFIMAIELGYPVECVAAWNGAPSVATLESGNAKYKYELSQIRAVLNDVDRFSIDVTFPDASIELVQNLVKCNLCNACIIETNTKGFCIISFEKTKNVKILQLIHLAWFGLADFVFRKDFENGTTAYLLNEPSRVNISPVIESYDKPIVEAICNNSTLCPW